MKEDLDDITNGWEKHDGFKIFVSTYNVLTNYEKTRQELKYTLFIRYDLELLMIHFNRWCKDLLFLAVFSNQNTATEVCTLVLGRNNLTTDEYYDEHHR